MSRLKRPRHAGRRRAISRAEADIREYPDLPVPRIRFHSWEVDPCNDLVIVEPRTDRYKTLRRGTRRRPRRHDRDYYRADDLDDDLDDDFDDDEGSP
jgi:hypothetical protein